MLFTEKLPKIATAPALGVIQEDSEEEYEDVEDPTQRLVNALNDINYLVCAKSCNGHSQKTSCHITSYHSTPVFSGQMILDNVLNVGVHVYRSEHHVVNIGDTKTFGISANMHDTLHTNISQQLHTTVRISEL